MKSKKDIFLIVIAAGLLFIPFLGSARLFDWDEINFAECAREMLATGNYLRVFIDYSPFWEKPPLFIWLQAASMSVLGINEFAARLPNAIIGMITLPLLYYWGVRARSRMFGILWAGAYAGSFLPNFYFHTAIIDPLFNLLIFSGIMTIAIADDPPRISRAVVSGGLIGLATLTKGPVALLISGVVIAIVFGVKYVENINLSKKLDIAESDNRSPRGRLTRYVAIYGAIFLSSLIVSLLWFGADIIKNGPWFITEFMRYQIRLLTTGDAGHGQPFYYHSVVLVLGCFPASIFAVLSLFKQKKQDKNTDFRLWNITLFWVVLIIFSIVKTKIIHYSSLCYFPITFLAADWAERAIAGADLWKKRHSIVFAVLGFGWAAALAAVPIIGMNKYAIMPFIRDDFARANLTAPVYWSGWEIAVGGIFAAGVTIALLSPIKYRFYVIYVATSVSILLFLPLVAPKIEGYTQAAPAEFYESLQGRECYIKPIGFKSYAHLFYSRKPFRLSPPALGIAPDNFENWLFEGNIDKPAYFVCRQADAASYRKRKQFQEISEKAGFVFFKRLPDSK